MRSMTHDDNCNYYLHSAADLRRILQAEHIRSGDALHYDITDKLWDGEYVNLEADAAVAAIGSDKDAAEMDLKQIRRGDRRQAAPVVVYWNVAVVMMLAKRNA
ncbi:MAG: hypothetical protein FRX49_02801 [Trebouxia sp. A1-2]|nr:MAG: hypothetical protein FRX49_02801 [Trebouxia sp. A1-2]